MEELKQIFQSVVGGKNFMTPFVEGFYRSGRYVCELSCSNGYEWFFEGYPFGVTVVDEIERRNCTELLKLFIDKDREKAKAMAIEYIKNLS